MGTVQSTARPDLLVFGCWNHQTTYWCAAARESGIPYWLFAHGVEIIGDRGWYMKRRRTIDFQSAEMIVANSMATVRRLRSLGVAEDSMTVLHPGANADALALDSPDGGNHPFVPTELSGVSFVLSIGRLIRRKGFDLALAAFVSIAGDFPGFHFVIAGDGPERSRLESAARSSDVGHRIHILGSVSQEMKIALLKNCVFFVMPNREFRDDMEGFGIVFREAALFGKASIGGNNGGVPEAILHNTTGLLVDTSVSHLPLVDAMRELLGSPARAAELGSNARREAVDAGTWEVSGRKFAELVEARIAARIEPTGKQHAVPGQ